MSGYEDLIHLPYPRKPQRMRNCDRAAQFSPFAALTGYEAAIAEAGRQTDCAIELGEDGKAIVDEKLRTLEAGQAVTVIYFQPDQRKAGGAYVRYTGSVRRVDSRGMMLTMDDGTLIGFGQIRDILK